MSFFPSSIFVKPCGLVKFYQARVHFYKTTLRHIPEDSTLRSHHFEKDKSQILQYFVPGNSLRDVPCVTFASSIYVTHKRTQVVLIHASGECGAIKWLREAKKKACHVTSHHPVSKNIRDYFYALFSFVCLFSKSQGLWSLSVNRNSFRYR
jgi:hypothetical protein